MKRSDADKRSQLASDIETAMQVRALAMHPEVAKWFDNYERAAINKMVDADSDAARAAAAARVKAVRDLKSHMAAIDAAATSARRRLDDMNRHEENIDG